MSERPLFDTRLIPGSSENPWEVQISPKRHIKRKLDLSPDEWKSLGETITEVTDLVRSDDKMHLDSGWRNRQSQYDATWSIRPNEK